MKGNLNAGYWILWVISIVGMFALIYDIFTAQTYSPLVSFAIAVFFTAAPIVGGWLYEKG